MSVISIFSLLACTSGDKVGNPGAPDPSGDSGAETVPGGDTDADSDADTDSDTDTDTDTDTAPPDTLSTATGCAGVYNPDQILTLYLDLDPGDWATVRNDTTYTTVVPAEFHCEDEAPLTVGLRRKRSGGTEKVGLKVDFNEYADIEWYGLHKLSLENGVSSGETSDATEVRDYIAEWLAWRVMNLSGAVSGRAAFVDVYVNGALLGVYVDVEQPDKVFLESRFGDDDGWLYKKSGGIDDGWKTHETEGVVDPYDAYFCFWANGADACEAPADDALLTELPEKLDIDQFLTFGAANAWLANHDGPLGKDNNYYFYDYDGGKRAYLPWDLDSATKQEVDVTDAEATAFEPVLFTHWYPDYVAILTEIVESRVSVDVVQGELARALSVAGPSLDADPYATGTANEAVDDLGAWWSDRDAEVRAQLGL